MATIVHSIVAIDSLPAIAEVSQQIRRRMTQSRSDGYNLFSEDGLNHTLCIAEVWIHLSRSLLCLTLQEIPRVAYRITSLYVGYVH